MLLNLHVKLWALGLAAFFLTHSSLAQDRVPLPNELERSEASAKIRNRYEADFAVAKTYQAKSNLAQQVLKSARNTQDSVERYVMLRLSLDIARAAEDWETATNAVLAMSEHYKINRKAVKEQIATLRKKQADQKHSKEMSDSVSARERGTKASEKFVVRSPWPEGEDQIVYDLPAAFEEVVLGGKGQYLVFLVTSREKLLFFDVRQRKVTGEIPLESSDAKFAVNANSAFIAYPGPNTIERWNLQTFEKTESRKLPFQHPIEAMVTGFASRGPIYIGSEHVPGLLLDPKSLRPISLRVIDNQYQRDGEMPGAGPQTRFRASANGKVFSVWSTNGSPGGFRTLVFKGRAVDSYYRHDTMGCIAPSPNGDLVYTAKGIYTNQAKEYAANDKLHAQSFSVPSVDSDYSVSVARDDNPKVKDSARVNIHVKGAPQPILTLPKVALRPGRYGDFHNRDRMTLDRRIYLFADANLLITLPESNEQIVMHRVKNLPPVK